MFLDEDINPMYKQDERRWEAEKRLEDTMRYTSMLPNKRPIHQLHFDNPLKGHKKCYYFHATDENHTDAYK